MFKKLIGIFLVTFLLLGSAMPMAMAAEKPTFTMEQNVAPNSAAGGVAKEMCMNDSYIFVSYGTYVEVYSYDKNAPEVAPVYQTQISYGNGQDSAGNKIPMLAYSMETVEYREKSYLLVGFVDTASTKGSYPRLNIYDVTSITSGATLEYRAQICMKAHTVGCEVSVKDGVVYLVEWQEGTSTDAYVWTFSLDRAFQSYDSYSSQSQAVDHANKIVDSKQAKVGTLLTSACVDGNYIYLAKRNGLIVLEVIRTTTTSTNADGTTETSITTAFNRKGQTYWDADTTQYYSSTIAAQGDYVYVSYAKSTVGVGGVQVWDVSATKASTTHAAEGTYAFTDEGLTPSVLIDNIYMPSQGAKVAVNGIMVNGDYLYVSYPELHLIGVYDISDMATFDWENPNNNYVFGCNLKTRGYHDDSTTATYANGGFHKMILADDVLYFTDAKLGFKTARVSPKHQVGELTVSDGTETVTTLADGTLAGKITITNTSSVPYSGVMILAYYKGDTLQAVETKEVMVPAGQMDYELTSDAITVSGAAGGDSVKAMLWFDTTSTLKPLTGAVTISVPDAE